MESDSDSGSDYQVEDYIRPAKVAKQSVNDESADLFGNFDAAKRKEFSDPSLYRKLDENGKEILSEESDDESAGEDEEVEFKQGEEKGDVDNSEPKEVNTKLSTSQLKSLLKGASKKNKYVLYVTNLNFETTKRDIEEFFWTAGQVKSVRIPPKRRNGFAFVEMATLEGFQNAFELHNSELKGNVMKIQISEGGKKKSANKKNIIKQKNRKLAGMRNETKAFCKSGKNYDRNIKNEKAKGMLGRNRWKKKPVGIPSS